MRRKRKLLEEVIPIFKKYDGVKVVKDNCFNRHIVTARLPLVAFCLLFSICYNFYQCKTKLLQDFENMEQWFANNILLLNKNKTKLLIMKERNFSYIDLHGQNIRFETVDTLSFLGICIDSELSWRPQIESVASKVVKCCYALRILTNTIGQGAALAAYHSYVQSRINYGIIFWARSVDANRIFILQKRCLRTIFKMKQTETCRNLFRENNILTLYSLYIYECVMYKINNSSEFEDLEMNHAYNTRSKAQSTASS